MHENNIDSVRVVGSSQKSIAVTESTLLCKRSSMFKGTLSSVPTHGISSNLHINNSFYTNYENVFIELDS